MSLTEAAKPAPPSSTLRSYAMIGIVLLAFGFLLNSLGNGLSQFWLVPYADIISALGFVIALYTASLAGVGTRLMVLIGLIYGIGTFYADEPPPTLLASGVGLGSDQRTHYIGLGLIAFTTVFLVALAFYLTREKRPSRAQPRTDPGSAN